MAKITMRARGEKLTPVSYSVFPNDDGKFGVSFLFGDSDIGGRLDDFFAWIHGRHPDDDIHKQRVVQFDTVEEADNAVVDFFGKYVRRLPRSRIVFLNNAYCDADYGDCAALIFAEADVNERTGSWEPGDNVKFVRAELEADCIQWDDGKSPFVGGRAWSGLFFPVKEIPDGETFEVIA